MNQSTLDDFTMSLALDGKFTGVDPASGTPWKRVSVNWPAELAPYWGTKTLSESVALGTANLVAAIKATYNTQPGPITVLGTSAGTLVVDEAMRALANDPAAPPPSALNFVVLADATQKFAGQDIDSVWDPFLTLSGYTYRPPPQTSYDLTVVTYEYDGFADFPDRWWNLYAVGNAIVGGLLLHAATWLVDLSAVPASDITVTQNSQNGVTTSYLIRAETLPLVQLFPSLAPVAGQLTQIIDSGYSRNDATEDSSSASAAIALDPQVSASTIDPPADLATTSVEEQDQSQQGDADATAASVSEIQERVKAKRPKLSDFGGTLGLAEKTPRAGSQQSKTTQAADNGATGRTGVENAQASTDEAGLGLPGESIAESVGDTVTKPVRNFSDRLSGLMGAGTGQAAGSAAATSGGGESGS